MGDLAWCVAEKVPHDDDGALLGRQSGESGENRGIGRLARVLGSGPLGELRLPAQAPRACSVDRAVHDDPMQPRPERAPAVEAVEVPDRGEKRLLRDVLGERAVVDDEIRRAVGAGPMSVEKRLEVRGGPALGASHPGALVSACARHRRTIRMGSPWRSTPEVRRAMIERSRDLSPAAPRTLGMNRRELLTAAVAAPLALSLPARSDARGAGGTPTVLVTADLESHVVALDASTGRIIRRIRTLPGPRSIEAAFLTWGVVANTASGRLTIVHAPTLRVRRVIEGLRAPRYTAVHPTRWPSDTDPSAAVLAYVTDSARNEVVTVDIDRGRILWRTAVPGPARHIGVTPDGELLWIALGTKAERIAVLDLDDPRRPRLVRTLAPPFLAHDVVCSEDASHVWVTSGDRRRLAIYERDGRRPVELLAAGAPPQHVAFRGRTAFVASGDDGTVRLHAHDGVLLNESRVPLGSYNVTSYGTDVTTVGAVAPSLGRGTLALLDRRGRVRRVEQVARAAHDACLVVS